MNELFEVVVDANEDVNASDYIQVAASSEAGLEYVHQSLRDTGGNDSEVLVAESDPPLPVPLETALGSPEEAASGPPSSLSELVNTGTLKGMTLQHKKDTVIALMKVPENKWKVRRIVENLNVTEHEWCKLLNLKPTKFGGYAQVSALGVNKLSSAGQMVLWSKGVYKTATDSEASHRCNQPRCVQIDHVVMESKVDNGDRKGCPVWIECGSNCTCEGSKVIWQCYHSPPCVKFHPGYTNIEQVRKLGTCRDASGEYLAYRQRIARTNLTVGLRQ